MSGLAALALLLAQQPPEAPADPALPAAAQTTLGFAEWLRAEGRLEAALLEYDRAVYQAPGTPDAARAALAAGACALDLERWDEASQRFATQPGDAARLGEAEALYAAGQHNDALRVLGEVGPGLAGPALYRAGWAQLRQGAADTAAATWAEVQDPTLQPGAQALQAELAAWEPLRLPRPAVAGVLSAALPGAGQLYAGEPRDALSALLVNSALIGGTATLASQRRWGGAAGLGLVALSFYTGNILSATQAARRTAARREQARLEALEAWELNLELAPEGAAWAPRVGPP